MVRSAVMLVSATLFAMTLAQAEGAPQQNHGRHAQPQTQQQNSPGRAQQQSNRGRAQQPTNPGRAQQQSNPGYAASPASPAAPPRCVGSCAPYGSMQGDRNPEIAPYPSQH
jgi:hypothetical protein